MYILTRGGPTSQIRVHGVWQLSMHLWGCPRAPSRTPSTHQWGIYYTTTAGSIDDAGQSDPGLLSLAGRKKKKPDSRHDTAAAAAAAAEAREVARKQKRTRSRPRYLVCSCRYKPHFALSPWTIGFHQGGPGSNHSSYASVDVFFNCFYSLLWGERWEEKKIGAVSFFVLASVLLS